MGVPRHTDAEIYWITQLDRATRERDDARKALSELQTEVPYRPGLPPEPQRRRVALWQVRRRDAGAGWGTDAQPFMLWFTVEERRLPREAAHTRTSILLPLDSDAWERFECRPCRASGTPCPWID